MRHVAATLLVKHRTYPLKAVFFFRFIWVGTAYSTALAFSKSSLSLKPHILQKGDNKEKVTNKTFRHNLFAEFEKMNLALMRL
jgi:hypothetical protein